jgi:hypothetical protein
VRALAAGAMVLAIAAAADAGPLSVVNVNAPAYNFVFSPAGTIRVSDTVDTFAVSGAVGLARLQSRTAIGQPGAPAAGKYLYAYRLNLTDVYGITFTPCIKSMKIRFGSIVSTFDYNSDGIAGDQVFVVTSGGLGSVGVASATQSGSDVTFTFAGGGVCAGSSPGTGDSSFFFGLVSTRESKFVTATITDGSSITYSPQARAPKSFYFIPGDYWFGLLQIAGDSSADLMLRLDVEAVRGNRFGGTLLVRQATDKDPMVFAVDGTLSAGGQLQIIGRGRSSHLVLTAGEEGGDAVFVGRYRLVLPDGGWREGILTLAPDARLVPTRTVEGGVR